MLEIDGERTGELDREVLLWITGILGVMNSEATDLETSYGKYSLGLDIPILFEEEYSTGLSISRSEHSDTWVLATWRDVEEASRAASPREREVDNVVSLRGEEHV